MEHLQVGLIIPDREEANLRGVLHLSQDNRHWIDIPSREFAFEDLFIQVIYATNEPVVWENEQIEAGIAGSVLLLVWGIGEVLMVRLREISCLFYPDLFSLQNAFSNFQQLILQYFQSIVVIISFHCSEGLHLVYFPAILRDRVPADSKTIRF